MVPPNFLIQPLWNISHEATLVTTFENDPAKRSIVYANPAFEELTGYKAADLIGKPASICDGAKTDRALLDAAEVSLRAGEPHECILVKYRQDRSDYCYHQALAPLVNDDGRVTHLIESGHMVPKTFPNFQPGKQDPHFDFTLPMPLLHFNDGHLPKHLQSTVETDALRALWEEKRGSKTLPTRDEVKHADLKRWLPHLSIADVLPNEQFQFSAFGSELTDVYGQDLTGALLNTLTPTDLWKVVIQHYREVVRAKRPLFAPISVSNGNWYTEVSRLLLPLSNDGETVSFILGADYSRTSQVKL